MYIYIYTHDTVLITVVDPTVLTQTEEIKVGETPTTSSITTFHAFTINPSYTSNRNQLRYRKKGGPHLEELATDEVS